MSLTSFINQKDVRAILKVIRPPPPRKLGIPLIVPRRSDRQSLIGTAFDYLLRFEIERRAAHALARRWIAEFAAELLHILSPRNLDRARLIVEAARSEHCAYVRKQSVDREDHEAIAYCAIRLAKFDPIFRAGKLDDMLFEKPDGDDIQELVSMLEIVPFELLIDAPLMLNPDFGDSSALIGGADADLLVGDMLMDVKTTINDSVRVDCLDQLLGYYLLAMRQRAVAPSFPEVKRLAIYFSRQGHLWIRPTSLWTDHPSFSEIEKWFFERCKDPTCPPPRITVVPAKGTVRRDTAKMAYLEAIRKRVKQFASAAPPARRATFRAR
jgi:hypothetical protein